MTEKNAKQVFRRYKRSADKGHIEDQFRTALCYQDGIGVKKNMCKAAEYMHSSADLGYAKAQYYTGLYYRQEVIKDTESDKKAFIYFLKASKQGNADAQVMVAKTYFRDQHEDNLKQGLFWLACAYVQDNLPAKEYLNVLFENETFGKGGYQITKLIKVIENIQQNFPHYINQ